LTTTIDGGGPGSGTRLRLLLAAERLFAQRGTADVSLREIAAAAEARNNSAGQYHFGSKDRLVDAICELRVAPVNSRRLYLIAEAQSRRGPTPLRAIVEASVLPSVESLGDEPESTWHARFVARLVIERGVSAWADGLDPTLTTGLRLTRAAIEQHLHQLPARTLRQRMRFAETLTIYTLAEFEQDRDAGTPWSGGRELLSSSLVDAVVGMLRTRSPERSTGDHEP
jgi:AcrR family transcriptional regulator